jgi:hypothetical protein
VRLENCYKKVEYVQTYFINYITEMPNPILTNPQAIINALPRFLLQKANKNIWQKLFSLPGTRLRNQLMEHVSGHVEIIAKIKQGLVNPHTTESIIQAISKRSNYQNQLQPTLI